MTDTTELRRHRVCESDLNYSCPQAGLENTYNYMRGKPCDCHVQYATPLLDALDKAEQRIVELMWARQTHEQLLSRATRAEARLVLAERLAEAVDDAHLRGVHKQEDLVDLHGGDWNRICAALSAFRESEKKG